MADLATTMRHMTATAGRADNIVPAWVLVERRRERAERQRRVATTIVGKADLAG